MQLALSPCQDTTTAVCACPATPLERRDLGCLSWLVMTGSKQAKFEFRKNQACNKPFSLYFTIKILFKF